MSKREIDLSDVRGCNAFVLLMKAHKLLSRSERREFDLEIPMEIIVGRSTEETPEWAYERLMSAITKRFKVKSPVLEADEPIYVKRVS